VTSSDHSQQRINNGCHNRKRNDRYATGFDRCALEAKPDIPEKVSDTVSEVIKETECPADKRHFEPGAAGESEIYAATGAFPVAESGRFRSFRTTDLADRLLVFLWRFG
jgi:hypothetical protein